MYEASFRLRGKTYDYKIQYEAIKKFMVLPKPDEVHYMLVMGLDPPLRPPSLALSAPLRLRPLTAGLGEATRHTTYARHQFPVP